VGKGGTAAIADLLRDRAQALRTFEQEEEPALLIVSLRRRTFQRIGVQRPATVLTGPDPATQVCRQTATKVN
jgi:hypothetical protein